MIRSNWPFRSFVPFEFNQFWIGQLVAFKTNPFAVSIHFAIVYDNLVNRQQPQIDFLIYIFQTQRVLLLIVSSVQRGGGSSSSTWDSDSQLIMNPIRNQLWIFLTMDKNAPLSMLT